MYANSQTPASAQAGIHRDLPALLARRRASRFQKPYAAYNCRAFHDSLARRERVAPGAPLILDAGCGTGASSILLATAYPRHYVIGVDRSAQRLKKHRSTLPDNLDLVRADLIDYWRLLRDANIRLARHYLFYPNPWPKIGHLARRWHAHPVFPTMLELGGRLECRSNWPIYLDEFCFAVGYLTGLSVDAERWRPEAVQTPFERKYFDSGHELFRAAVDLSCDSVAHVKPARHSLDGGVW